uniref:Uncharacterized protein n=1 Tax=Cacopsylla melanoneura TaxID=428564 RepID=A0A8D8XLB8_9HEMI
MIFSNFRITYRTLTYRTEFTKSVQYGLLRIQCRLPIRLRKDCRTRWKIPGVFPAVSKASIIRIRRVSLSGTGVRYTNDFTWPFAGAFENLQFTFSTTSVGLRKKIFRPFL